ncbi:MAG: DUF4388 domain-containing protein [Desulfuromonas sp.]
MNRKTGNLNQISLAELLRGCALQQRTGTLTLCREGLCKRLYFNHGHLIYLTSNKGGRTGRRISGPAWRSDHGLGRLPAAGQQTQRPYLHRQPAEKEHLRPAAAAAGPVTAGHRGPGRRPELDPGHL